MTDNHAAFPAHEKDAIHQVVAGYFDAFSRDAAAVAAFYGEPALIVMKDTVLGASTRADVQAFFSKALAGLKARGYAKTVLDSPRLKILNSTTALYGAVAIRVKTDGTELGRFGFTYLLRKDAMGWKIVELIATDLDKLISAD